MNKFLLILVLALSFSFNVSAQIQNDQLTKDLELIQQELDKAMEQMNSLFGGALLELDSTSAPIPNDFQLDQFLGDDFQIAELFNKMAKELDQVPEKDRKQMEQLFQELGFDSAVLNDLEELLNDFSDNTKEEKKEKKRKVHRM